MKKRIRIFVTLHCRNLIYCILTQLSATVAGERHEQLVLVPECQRVKARIVQEETPPVVNIITKCDLSVSCSGVFNPEKVKRNKEY